MVTRENYKKAGSVQLPAPSKTHYVENSLCYSCHKIFGYYFFECGSFLYFFVMVSYSRVTVEHQETAAIILI